MESINFNDPETGENYSLFVVAETVLNENRYLLVTEEEEGDSDALILKELSTESSDETIYEIVDDDDLLEAVSKVFSELLEDTEVTFEE